jgi:hypothetical protein
MSFFPDLQSLISDLSCICIRLLGSNERIL